MFRTLLIFVGLGPPIGAVTMLVYLVFDSLWLSGLREWVVMVSIALIYSYLFGALQAAIAGIVTHLTRALKPLSHILVVAATALGLGFATTLVLALLFAGDVRSAFNEGVIPAYMITCLVPALACLALVRRRKDEAERISP